MTLLPAHIGVPSKLVKVNHPPVFNLQPHVAVRQSSQTMGDHEDGAALHEALHRIHYHRLGLRIDGAGRLVEDEDGGIFQKGASKRDTLPLTTRKAEATFPNTSFVSVGQLDDKLVGICGLRGLDDLLFAGVGTGVGDVLSDAGGEENRLLEDDSELVAQVRQLV